MAGRVEMVPERQVRHLLTSVLLTSIGLSAVGGAQLVDEAGREFSCASFPANLSEAALVERYGDAHVRRASIFGADDGPQEGAAVFDGTPAKIEVVWWDPETRTRLAWARTREFGSPWRTPNGVALGMDLRSLERYNGGPFRLAGLGGPEGGGVIRSWGRGRLQRADPEDCRLSISLQPSAARPADPALFGHVLRGREFSSGHPAMQAINPEVAALIVGHNPIRRHGRP